MASPDSIPRTYRLAAGWAWRFLVLAGAVWVLLFLANKFLALLLPLFVACLLASVARPAAAWLVGRGVPEKPAAILIFLSTLCGLGLLFYFVVAQVMGNSDELKRQVIDGIARVEQWLITGPLSVSERQISAAGDKLEELVKSPPAQVWDFAAGFGGTVGNVVAGLLIVVFAYFFILTDGPRIGAWLVRLFPRNARARAASSGQVAWTALTRYTQATMLVAFVDALGIMAVAALLDVPLVLAIGVLVFLGSFIPMVGGLLTGMVAVLLALVAQGPTEALLMLGGVVAVQQVEGNLLQPLILGRFVAVHPLAVLLGLSAGFLVAGIPGALVVVPLIACCNAVVLHLSGGLAVGEEAEPSTEVPLDELGPAMGEQTAASAPAPPTDAPTPKAE